MTSSVGGFNATLRRHGGGGANMSVAGKGGGQIVPLAGKVALVTGGASGIGLATAGLLSNAGASVVVVDISELAGETPAAGSSTLYVRGDVGEAADWDRIVAVAGESFGGIDLAFLNAGVITPEPDVTAITDGAYRRIVSANVDGVFYGVRAVVPSMQNRGGGAIVATASLAGLISYSPDPVYAMTKHAVVGLVRALAPQLQSKGITINAICPGLVDTPLLSAEAKSMAAEVGFPLIPVTDIAVAVLERMTGTDTGRAWVCQAGREATAYRFAGVPGPGGTAAGRTPPAALAAHDQLSDS
jgi:NAD(P)-dependent dehydrogenase (short-subunit alcohol dehydrogenase family)